MTTNAFMSMSQGDCKVPRVDLNGASIHVTDTGGDGEVFVFSHGPLFSGAMFEDQVAQFRGSYRCVTFPLYRHLGDER